MKFAIYQMDIVPGDPQANREKVKNWVEDVCTEQKPDTLMLPEMWTTGYTLPILDQIAEREDGETFHFLSQLAKRYQVNFVAGSIATKLERGIVNRALVFDRQGECIYHYDKMHLVPMLKEPDYLVGGQEPLKTFTLDGHVCGLFICYDLRFPELARQLALNKAEIVFVPAEWPDERKIHWGVLQQARAIENQMYMITANRVGEYDDVIFAGKSAVTNPWGDQLAVGTFNEEETLHVEINLSKVPEIREAVPVFKSRVPHLYEIK
ncbi:carbon-nitrogen family hydrolase [Bacillus sp. FJAT-45037]|uniref:carbon-nitrogen family hydrolase n=1 Tax=Bacillus sp. FJAT-45037 TaxID=2011007 RepID=UPI000C23575C|nr:carbon-nitrogen family hydrolase [Bacillus sp. FJAT-45037]